MESCYISIVEYNPDIKFRGVYNIISEQEISVFLEYDIKEKIEELKPLVKVLESTSYVNLHLHGESGNVITCLNCFSLTPFVTRYSQYEKVASRLPYNEFGLIRFFCNRWIEDMLISSSDDLCWTKAILSFPNIDRWFLGANNETPLRIQSCGLSLSFESQKNVSFSGITTEKKEVWKGQIVISSDKKKSIENLEKIHTSLYYFLVFILRHRLAPVQIEILNKDSIGVIETCKFHYHPVDELSNNNLDVSIFVNCRFSVQQLQAKPGVLPKWFDLHKRVPFVMFAYTQSLKDGYPDEKTVLLLQAFDSLSKVIDEEPLFNKDSFQTWILKVASYGEELRDEGLTIAKERIEGALSGLNQISLKSRLNNFFLLQNT